MQFFTQRLFGLKRSQKIAVQIAIDASLISICFVVSMAIRLESFDFLANSAIWGPFGISLLAALVSLFLFGVYRSLVRFVTGEILSSVAMAAAISAIALFVSNSLLSAGVPRSVPFIHGVLLFLAVGGVRFAARQVFRQSMRSVKPRVVIYGAGEAGLELANTLYHGRDYTPVAFVDDNVALHGMTVAGRTVHPPSKLESLVQGRGVQAVLLALPSVSRMRRRAIIAELEGLGVEIKTIPAMSDILSGRAKLSELREVSLEDLLGRDTVAPNDALLKKNITGKRVFVSGAGGSIGSELCRQILLQNPTSLILYEMSEFGLYAIEAELSELAKKMNASTEIIPVLGSVQNTQRLKATMRSFQPQTIFHAAAYKHVPLIEDNVIEGVRNNVFGTLAIADLSQKLGVENFILISTDKAVRPTNVMGATKRIAELICQSLSQGNSDTTFSMVRFGNVLGSSGSVIPRFRQQIDAGGPVTVTHPEVTRYFMTIPEAAQLVLQAGALGKGGDVFVLDMGQPVKISDLAASMVRLHGLVPYFVEDLSHAFPEKGDIAICFTGLRKGEKLYEELLIGADPKKTEHPRIMTASEACLPEVELQGALNRLRDACMDFDIPRIFEIFHDLPLEFQPSEHPFQPAVSLQEQQSKDGSASEKRAAE